MQVEVKNDVVHIDIGESLTYAQFKQLKKIYKKYPKNTQYVLNFARTTHIDSSGLGLLLTIKHHNDSKTNKKITFINCNMRIKSIFNIANFDLLFNIR